MTVTAATPGPAVALPPLLEPGPPLTERARSRYARQLALPGFDDADQQAQRRLAAARVLVIGAGGLGSACAPYLVSSGFGTVGLCDDDDVELSNLHRQVAHGHRDVGRAKVDSLADTLVRLDPDVRVERHHERLTARHALDLLADYDLVLDGTDNFPTRYLTDHAAEIAGMPLVWGAIGRFGGQVSVAWAAHGPRYRDLFPTAPPAGTVQDCADGGVLPGVCAVIGGLMASEAVKVVTGIGRPLLGVVTIYDALAGSFRTVDFERSPDAPEADLRSVPQQPGHCVSTATSTSPLDLAAALRRDANRAPVLVDVREAPEHALDEGLTGHRDLPMSGFDPGLLADVPRTHPVVVYCSRGARSAAAAELLRDAGFSNVTHLAGGLRMFRATEGAR